MPTSHSGPLTLSSINQSSDSLTSTTNQIFIKLIKNNGTIKLMYSCVTLVNYPTIFPFFYCLFLLMTDFIRKNEFSQSNFFFQVSYPQNIWNYSKNIYGGEPNFLYKELKFLLHNTLPHSKLFRNFKSTSTNQIMKY